MPEKVSMSAVKRVKVLLEEGSKCPCDQSCDNFEGSKIPDFYDEEKFKRYVIFRTEILIRTTKTDFLAQNQIITNRIFQNVEILVRV